jgi:hypothetical protein
LNPGFKGFSALAKLAILGNISKGGNDYERDRNQQIPALVIRSGTPVSDTSGRDLPSPAEIRNDMNVQLLPFY